MNHKQEIKKRILNICGQEPNSLEDLAECVITVINQQPVDRYKRSYRTEQIKIAGFRWDIAHSDSVSNTHDCPIDGVTNWAGRVKDAPRGYPGWYGRVWIRYTNKPDSFGSDPFHATLTYPGTGGFGGYNGPWDAVYSAWCKHEKAFPEPQIYSWDYRFFDQDWPNLYKNNLFEIVKQIPMAQTNTWQWFDPEVEEQDDKLLRFMRKK